MRYWSVLISAHRYATERLYANETVWLAGDGLLGADALMVDAPVAGSLRAGDRVALVADVEPPVVFGLAEVAPIGGDGVSLAYTDRFLDQPKLATDVVPSAGPVRELTEAGFRTLLPTTSGPKRPWLVSLDLPIEAAGPAEAVRRFWTFVRDLGPSELPAFVRPSGDELAMQAYVLGAEANLDPEEDD